MEKKFTRGMLCEEFGSTCRECPLHSNRNSYGKPCWILDEDEIQVVMKDYPYADVKNRMKFNDIETRLTAVEEKVEKKDTDGVEFTFKPGRIISGSFSTEVVDKKLYDKLEAKHEADCRLISEYDIENKKLKEQNAAQNDIVCDLYSNLCTEQKERIRCEAVIEDKNKQIGEWKKRYKELEYLYEKKNEESNNLEDRYRRHNADLKSRLFDLKNAENERDHYKGLYSSKCDDYDRLLEKQIKLEEKCGYLERENKTFNVLLINKTETIGKLGDEYDKLKEQNSILTKENIRLTESNDTATKENLELEGENDALSTRNAFLENIVEELEDKIVTQKNRITNLESKLRNQRANLTSLQEKYEDAVKMNKAREDVYYANIKLQKTIEAKDREIGLLRAELDKYTPDDDDECDDRWID